MKPQQLQPTCALAALLSITALAVPLGAADWSGSAGVNWDAPANWGGSVPTSADTAQFTSASYANQPTVNVAAAASNLKMTAASGAVALGAGNPLSLSLSGATPDAAIDLRSAAADMTLHGDVVLAGGSFHKFGVAAGRTLTVNGNVTGNKRLDLTGDQTGDPIGSVGTGGTVVLNGLANLFSSVFIKAGTLAIKSFTGMPTGTVFVMQGSEVSRPTLKYVGAAVSSAWKPQLKPKANAGVAGYAAIDASGTGALNLTNTAALAYAAANVAPATHLVLTGTNTGNNTLAWILKDNGTDFPLSLTKSGAGTWVLGGANTYTGATTVSSGTLALGGGGAIAGSTAIHVVAGATFDVSGVTGGWTLGAGQTLTGTGTVAGNATINGSVAPGAPGGILTANNNVTFASGSSLKIGLDPQGAPPSGAALAVGGALNITAATLDLTVTGSLTDNAYVIATYGSLTGPFAGVNGVPNGYEVDYTFNSNTAIAIKLTPYMKWIGGFSVGGLTGLGDDPDADGVANAVEFALDSSPASGAARGKVFIRLATVGGVPNILTLTTAVRAGASFAAEGNNQKAVVSSDGLTYLIEGSDTLADWGTPVVSQVTGTDATNIQGSLPEQPKAGWTYQTFRTPGDISAAPRRFLRVRVTATP